jgi:AbiV family abortive infection protein
MDKELSLKKISTILDGKTNFKIDDTREFNKCVQHVENLLEDANLLYQNKSYGSSTFFSISAIEEIGKVIVGSYAKLPETGERVKTDLLRDHRNKEIIGTNYTITMGERLQNAIGQKMMEKIIEFAQQGKLKQLRESSIYCDKDKTSNRLIVPMDIISKEFSRAMLLFAIESFDDNLVGLTNFSMEISQKTDTLFAELSES